MFTNGHLDSVGKEVSAQFLGGRVELIADHRRVTPASAQLTQHLQNAVVRTGRVKRVFQIVLPEGVKRRFQQLR